MQTLNDLLKSALSENNMTVSAPVEEALIQYLNLLKTWNHAFNLTAITEPRDMVYLHLIDSLAAAPFIKNTHCLDVGSGAGLPGIPLALTHPEQQWVTIDKSSKKMRFITQVIAELKLTNLQAVANRVEDFHPSEKFNTIISRAYGTLRLFIESTAHLLNSDGIFIAMKGKYPQDELDHLPAGFQVKSVTPIQLKGLEVERHIIIMQRK